MSDHIVVRITTNPGEIVLDRMISVTILLVGMTLIFLLVVLTLPAFAGYAGVAVPVVFPVALLWTLIPTTIGGLVSAIGIAGMDRLVRFNVIAKSGRAVEAVGDVDVLLLDKAGAITLGNRQAAGFIPVVGAADTILARIGQRNAPRDLTAAAIAARPGLNDAGACIIITLPVSEPLAVPE